MKKILTILLALTLFGIALTGCSKNADTVPETKKISINVYDKESELIYSETIETTEKKLFDAMVNIEELKIKYDNSEYGKYLTSIMGIEQGDNYYWNYYIDSEYATVGVSSYSLQNNEVYDFRIEKFE